MIDACVGATVGDGVGVDVGASVDGIEVILISGGIDRTPSVGTSAAAGGSEG